MSAEAPAAPLLQVARPGPFTTVQDLGRPGRRLAGVPPGGAMDRFALCAANLLVGNPEGAPALECALMGPTLEAVASCLVAVTGADFGPLLNGTPLPGWSGVFLAAGDRLTFAGRRWGARAYLAVGGGVAAERWLGSAATYLLAARGGIHGRALKAGDVLCDAGLRVGPRVAGRRLPEPERPGYRSQPELAAVTGPHFRRLAPASRRGLFQEGWTVSRDADRMGYRLEGPVLTAPGPELLSFGVTFGCLQLPASGQPILLMADGQTAGGYPVIAGVVRSGLPLAAQLLPGDRLRLRETSVEAAQAEWRRLRRGLEKLR